MKAPEGGSGGSTPTPTNSDAPVNSRVVNGQTTNSSFAVTYEPPTSNKAFYGVQVWVNNQYVTYKAASAPKPIVISQLNGQALRPGTTYKVKIRAVGEGHQTYGPELTVTTSQ